MFTQAKSRFQTWKNQHNLSDDDVITAGFFATAAVAVVGMAIIAVKQSAAYAAEVEKQEAWEKDQLTQGRVILPSEDGMHMLSVEIKDIY